MEYPKAEKLINKYRKGETTAAENALLESWYLKEGLKSAPYAEEIDYHAEEEALWKKIQKQRVSSRQAKLWPRIAVAAAVALIVFGVYLLNYPKHESSQQNQHHVLVNDIKHGKNMATLTLSNGKKIILSDALTGELAKEAGVVIKKSADGQVIYDIQSNSGNNGATKYNTLTTSRGQQFQVHLPDGSKVWLNAGSKLTYPTTYVNAARREVKLTGEAYFEIARSNNKLKVVGGKAISTRIPFIVKTAKQEVEVLGTHFNINAYTDEPVVKTTLIEGKVKVRGFNGHEEILKPGEQSTLTENSLLIRRADEEEVLAWKNGLFIFNDEPLESIMRKISRWYDVTVVYEGNVNRNQLFGGAVSKYDDISIILRKLEITEGVHFKIQGRRIIVTR